MWASRELKEIWVPILARPGGGYEKNHRSIESHLVQDLGEQGDGWKCISEFGDPGNNERVAL